MKNGQDKTRRMLALIKQAEKEYKYFTTCSLKKTFADCITIEEGGIMYLWINNDNDSTIAVKEK